MRSRLPCRVLLFVGASGAGRAAVVVTTAALALSLVGPSRRSRR